MKWYIEKFVNMSLAQLWQLLSKPWKISAALTAPPPSSSKNAIQSLFPDQTPESIEAYRSEFIGNHRFFAELNKKLVEKRGTRTCCGGWKDFIYMAVRLKKPGIIIETGVFDGLSTAVFLQALHDNKDGFLISVDLPATKTIVGSTHRMYATTLPHDYRPGWVIPDYLRERHRLVLGDSKIILPKLFREYPKIDIFFHDSLHTFEHMYFEYSTAWPHLSEGGLLFSDDIFWSEAFHKFCRENRRKYLRIKGLGAVRK